LFGNFYSPKQVAERLIEAAKKGITYSEYWHRRIPIVNKLRLSGCEPTIGKEHLLAVLENLAGKGYPFYLETNGILFEADEAYVKKLAEFSDFIYVRVSFKAATPEGFARAAAMTDPK